MAEIALNPRVDRAAPDSESAGPADSAWVSPAQLLATLRRRWGLILVCGLLCAAGAYAYTSLVLPKLYTSSGTVAIEMRNVMIPALQGALSSDCYGRPDAAGAQRDAGAELARAGAAGRVRPAPGP